MPCGCSAARHSPCSSCRFVRAAPVPCKGLHVTRCLITCSPAKPPAAFVLRLHKATRIASLCMQRSAHCAGTTLCSRFPGCPSLRHSRPPLVVPPAGVLGRLAVVQCLQWCGTAALLFGRGRFSIRKIIIVGTMSPQKHSYFFIIFN